MSKRARSFILIAVLGFLASLAIAQEPEPAQGRGGGRPRPPAGPAPRLPDGHPDLGNDKGIWSPNVVPNIAGIDSIGHRQTRVVEKPPDIQFLPGALEVYKQRSGTLSKDDPEAHCLPPGNPRMMATPFPFQIYQYPTRVIFLFEGGAHIWRIIYMDGRQHPKDPNPTFLGDSIGHWEGDTLVADVVGLNDQTWLDEVGHPHSDALHVVERFTRVDSNTLHYQATIDDPKTYAKPWTTSWNIPWRAGEELLEYICQQNNKDLQHLVGK